MSERPRAGAAGVTLSAAGTVAYVLAVDAGHWSEARIVPRDCAAVGVGDNCTQVLVPGPDYVPHGGYGWLGWLGVTAFAVGAILLAGAALRARAWRRGGYAELTAQGSGHPVE
ncbi:hypothetical protein [Streptacidiphilus anmyonensis]|uniref:hypothetical protein n=1 Tax=Streptacidiphilus anmyonensis TaxID=405782 RepID=UPI0005A61CF4|nr:hypothetical protein [Streptacidiphilus anmyonensis]